MAVFKSPANCIYAFANRFSAATLNNKSYMRWFFASCYSAFNFSPRQIYRFVPSCAQRSSRLSCTHRPRNRPPTTIHCTNSTYSRTEKSVRERESGRSASYARFDFRACKFVYHTWLERQKVCTFYVYIQQSAIFI